MLRDYVILDELGFAPLDDTGAQLLFRFVAAAYERRSLGVASHWPFEEWGRFLPEHTTAGSMLDRLLHHAHVVVTQGDSYRMREARSKGGTHRRNLINPKDGGLSLATSEDQNLAVDRCRHPTCVTPAEISPCARSQLLATAMSTVRDFIRTPAVAGRARTASQAPRAASRWPAVALMDAPRMQRLRQDERTAAHR